MVHLLTIIIMYGKPLTHTDHEVEGTLDLNHVVGETLDHGYDAEENLSSVPPMSEEISPLQSHSPLESPVSGLKSQSQPLGNSVT